MAAGDDDALTKKKKVTSPSTGVVTGGPSRQMALVMNVTRAVGIALGGFVSVVSLMALLGLVIESLWPRLILALVIAVGLPALAADQLLKRTRMKGGFLLVADTFGIVLLAVALLLVSIEIAKKGMLVREGDRYARDGSRTMARVLYFMGGADPVFPGEDGWQKPHDEAK